MFQRFFWLVIRFAEEVFGIYNSIIDYFQCFGHSSVAFLENSLARRMPMGSKVTHSARTDADRFMQFHVSDRPARNSFKHFALRITADSLQKTGREDKR